MSTWLDLRCQSGRAICPISFDIVRRYFEYKGFEVTFVSNITDVDDKMISVLRRGITGEQLCYSQYAKITERGVEAPTHQPRATQYKRWLG